MANEDPDNASGEMQGSAATPAGEGKGGRGWSGPVAVLALLLGLGSAAGLGYGYWHLDQRLRAVQDQAAEAASSDESLRERIDGFEAELGSVTDRQERLTARMEAIDERLAGIRDLERTLRQRLEEGGSRWRIQRIGALLRTAKRLGRLEGDAAAAEAALDSAADLLAELADERWQPVLEAVDSARDALAQGQQPDIGTVTRRLTQLKEQAMALDLGLPLATRDGQGEASGGSQPTKPGGASADSGWRATLWQGLTQFWADVRTLVRIRPAGESVQPLMPPREAEFLRQNLVLTLETARAAAVRGEATVYKRSLAHAAEWLEQYFAGDSDALRDLRQALQSLQSERIAANLPDLAAPLAAYREAREAEEAGS